jgi:chondroitin 4-sulfotransferase 11
MLYHQYRCIFIHIPKTAGKSVSHALGFGWPGHKDISLYAEELKPEVFQSFFKFAVVRNPWDRLVSEFNYQQKKKRPKKDKLFVFDGKGSTREFGDWVRTAFENPFHYRGADWAGDVSPHIHRWSPQVDWISVNGKIAVDFVARIENMQQDFGVICQKLGLAARLEHRNSKFHWHYSHYYDDATRDLVGKYYARDVEAFGYTFEEQPRVASTQRWWMGCAERFGWSRVRQTLLR